MAIESIHAIIVDEADGVNAINVIYGGATKMKTILWIHVVKMTERVNIHVMKVLEEQYILNI